MDETVYGMEEVKRGISVFVYKVLRGIRSEKVILIAAKSGTGKSYLISELSKIIPLTVADSSSITASGYKGSKTAIPFFVFKQGIILAAPGSSLSAPHLSRTEHTLDLLISNP